MKIDEENQRLKQNYDILKEHEISIIRDFENKKSKESNFYETSMLDL